MTMQEDRYAPCPLSTSHEYPGYQFYAVLRYQGRTSGECLRYAALTVQNWLCERVRQAGSEVPEEIRCAPAASFAEIAPEDLKSAKLSYSEIISLPDEGIWAIMVREPDPEIAARSFLTHVGLRVKNDDEVEFGVSVDIVDRDPELPEADRAYRPQFVRLLFETENMCLSQVEPLQFRQYTAISDKRGVSRLKDLADARDNQLPLIVFTHAKRTHIPEADIQHLVGELMKPAVFLKFGQPTPQESPHYLPYDAEEFSRHIYGFARAFVVMPEAFKELNSKFNRAHLKEGDLLIIEPRAFGGAVKTYQYKEGLAESWFNGITDELLSTLQCYSKHKPYSFGKVLFEDDARQVLKTREFEALRVSISLKENAEMRQLLELLERECASGIEQTEYINNLKAQMRDEYVRGAESERHRAEQLEAQLNKLKTEISALRANNDAMQQSFAELRALREVAAGMQTVASMPKTAEEVVDYFRLMFSDRLGFTQRGLKTAAKCDINPDMLWTCLYQTATVLVDLYREGSQDVEKAFREYTGWELATTEGAMTRRTQDYMNLRKDVFDGREISIEPHIKFPKSLRRTGAQYQRLYYAYDQYTRKIIIGYVGDHLENYLTLSFH